MKALRDHGDTVDIDSAAISFEGSELFRQFDGREGRFQIQGNRRRKAAVRVSVGAGTTEPNFFELIGEIVGGTESVTFEGAGLGGLYSMRFQVPIQRSHESLNL